MLLQQLEVTIFVAKTVAFRFLNDKILRLFKQGNMQFHSVPSIVPETSCSRIYELQE
jgi:hypothetical protein